MQKIITSRLLSSLNKIAIPERPKFPSCFLIVSFLVIRLLTCFSFFWMACKLIYDQIIALFFLPKKYIQSTHELIPSMANHVHVKCRCNINMTKKHENIKRKYDNNNVSTTIDDEKQFVSLSMIVFRFVLFWKIRNYALFDGMIFESLI